MREGDESWPHVDYQSCEAPQGGCLHELFEAQADERGAATALICGDESLSYAELEIRANRLAHHLRRLGAAPDVLVGLCLDRSELPIIAILACLKAGGAYVPIDPAFPDDRIRHIVSEAEIAVLLTEKRFIYRASKLFGGPIVALDACKGEIENEPAERLSRTDTGLTRDDVCYVLYTSGTTGRPKGVVTEHRNVTHFVRVFNAVCTTTPDDRVFQGFPLGFDGSVEEIWMAFSNGAALVVGTKETPRFGNDLAHYLATMGVTYFSTVPTMLSTMTEDVRSLRQLVVSGEICPPELVARWARKGRRMLNVYGPTEATVNTTAALCEPGRPVTIGRPLDGYATLILNADMRPVPPGVKGELYIGGGGIARGYLNQPEITARSFIRHCSATRLYRTGDLARVNEEGEIEFFGRIDSQVKIRGYRVELSEIESVLLEQEPIASAAVRLYDREGAPCLAAYVVLQGAPAPLDRGQVLESLRARLPSYMVPAYLDIVDTLPMLTSGKIDRTRLGQPVSPLVGEASQSSKPATPLEVRIADIWAAVFRVAQVGAEQDFFLDLGGHSLLAAQMVASLRTRADIHIAVRDVYAFPTVRKLSEHVEKQRFAAASSPERQIAVATSPLQNAPCKPSFVLVAAQSATILLLLVVISLPLYGVAIADTFHDGTSILSTVAYFACFFLVLWLVMLALSIGGKWLIIGRYRPGAHPLWGSYYFRWWLVSRLQALSGAGIFIGTPLLPLYYRLMGAKVGRNCALDTALCSIWDLVSIGDDASIGADTQLLGCRIENQHLIIGRVDVGSRCFIGLHSALGLNVKIGDGGRLDDQSLLPDGEHIPAGEARRGSPARKAEVAVPEGDPPRRSRLGIALFTAAQAVSAFALVLMISLPALAVTLLADYANISSSITLSLLFVVVATPLLVLVECLWVAAAKAMVLHRVKPGVYDLHTMDDLRCWLAAGLMRASRTVLLPLFTTLYLPPWMRLLGARIGKNSEMSTIFSFLPDLLTAGDGSFFADGSILGGRRTNCGRFEVKANSVGQRSFVGNSAILSSGASLGNNCLLGVLSAPPERSRPTPDGTDWLGSPGFLLPNRQKVAGFEDTVTYKPTKKLYAQRAVIDACRILIPAYTVILLSIGGLAGLLSANTLFGVGGMLAVAPLAALIMAALAVLVVVGLKWAVMGVFKPVVVPLWCPYVWLNEMINGAYEFIMAPVVAFFFGTPFAAFLLRLLGCKIGRHCYIGTSLFSEFDLVRIGNHAALNSGAVMQNHLFEDRIMKSSHLSIRDGCSVGNMAVVLYDTRMEEHAVLGPLSLLMKGEIMPARSRWHGIPTIQG
jgi:non-ribosomal peptide synthetase-like protein